MNLDHNTTPPPTHIIATCSPRHNTQDQAARSRRRQSLPTAADLVHPYPLSPTSASIEGTTPERRRRPNRSFGLSPEISRAGEGGIQPRCRLQEGARSQYKLAAHGFSRPIFFFFLFFIEAPGVRPARRSTINDRVTMKYPIRFLFSLSIISKYKCSMADIMNNLNVYVRHGYIQKRLKINVIDTFYLQFETHLA
jgi:hypothetical protein